MSTGHGTRPNSALLLARVEIGADVIGTSAIGAKLKLVLSCNCAELISTHCLTKLFQIDEIWMEFCCEEKFTAKQEFVESETKKYEFEEETEIVEDFGKVSQKVQF